MQTIDSRNIHPTRDRIKGEWSGQRYLEAIPENTTLIWNQNHPSWVSPIVDIEIPLIIVGRCKSQAWNGGDGYGAQRHGCFIKKYRNDGAWVDSVFVPASSKFDPDKVNNLGQKGAYVVVPPADEEINQAILSLL